MKQTNRRHFYNRVGAAALSLGLGLIAINVKPASASPAAGGAATFTAKCGGCHGADGAGSTPMGQKLKVKDLRSPEVQKLSDEDLAEIISKGKTPMPAFGKTLAPAAITELVAYLRSIAAKS